MQLDDILQHVAEDFKKIDKLDLTEEFLKLSTLFAKYIKMKSDETIRLAVLYNNRRALVNDKNEYYWGRADASVYQQKPFNIKLKTQAGVDKYVESDEDIIEHDNKIAIQKEKVEVLNAALNEIKNRQWTVKGAQDQIKFENGY